MPLQKDSLFSKYYFAVGFALTGAASPAFTNYYNKRPFHAGIQKHALGAVIGFVFGLYAERYVRQRFAYRDAVIKHYIELHPEDFVENQRKYKEIFEEWTPVR